MPYVSGLLRDEKVTNDDEGATLVTWIKFPDKKARILRRAKVVAAAAFRAHLNLYVEKLDVHCNYADALPGGHPSK